MANGDITKEIEYDKIEVVSTWSIQVVRLQRSWKNRQTVLKQNLVATFTDTFFSLLIQFTHQPGKLLRL